MSFVMNSVRSNNLSLKNQRFTPSGYKDIEKRKFYLEAKKLLKCLQVTPSSYYVVL